MTNPTEILILRQKYISFGFLIPYLLFFIVPCGTFLISDYHYEIVPVHQDPSFCLYLIFALNVLSKWFYIHVPRGTDSFDKTKQIACFSSFFCRFAGCCLNGQLKGCSLWAGSLELKQVSLLVWNWYFFEPALFHGKQYVTFFAWICFTWNNARLWEISRQYFLWGFHLWEKQVLSVVVVLKWQETFQYPALKMLICVA